MALNFPDSPSIGDQYTSGGTTWEFDGTVWNVVPAQVSVNVNTFNTIAADTGSTTADINNDTLTVAGGSNVTTAITGDTLTINANVTGGVTNAFSTVVTDDGQYAASGSDTLNVLGRTNIATELTTDSNDLHIDLVSFSIDFLSDVDTTSSAPAVGQVLKWDGNHWAPGFDVTSGGSGLDADTLDGFDSTYYLDYNNFTNTPTVATLADFSVGNELTASGDGAISYDNTTGVFRYTPPDLSSYLTSYTETNDLTAAVTWANVPNANITQSSVTQHQSALSITESQISDLGSYLTSVSATDLNSISIDALSDVDTTTSAPNNGEVLSWNSTNSVWEPASVASGGGGISLTDLSVTQNTASGGGTLTYNNTSGVFSYTPPVVPTSIEDLSDVAFTWAQNAPLDAKGSVLYWNGTEWENAFPNIIRGDTGFFTINNIVEPTLVQFKVGSVGITAYTFQPHYSANNPTIYVLSGTTVSFDLTNATGHPFEIQDPLGNQYNTGVFHVSNEGRVLTGSQAQGWSDGTLYWRIPENISGGYRYQCTAHPAMVGSIQVKRFSTI